MNSKLTYRRTLWIVLIPLLVGCGSVTATVPIATPTKVDMNAFSTHIARTVVAQITQTAFVTPTRTRPPTGTPWPTETPLPVYALDRQLKAFIVDGNLYIQNGDGESLQLTHSKADRDPFFSDDGKKIVFHRWTDNSFYSIDADGSNEQKIFNVPSLAVQDHAEIKALTFIKNTHILLFNIYICGPRALYNAGDCFVSTYSVDADSGKTEEIGQRVSGIGFDNGNFQISPNQKYLSIAGSGHINIFSFSAGHFKLAYFGALTYRITRPDEFLPYQYWLPDSSGLIAIVSADQYNEPGTPPQVYAVWRYTLVNNKAVRLALDPLPQRIHGTSCNFSVSPDRDWIFYASDKYSGDDIKVYLGNLKTGQAQEYKWGGGCGGADTLYSLKWSPDSKRFASSSSFRDVIGSVNGLSPISVGGNFEGWIDSTHYYYSTIVDTVSTIKNYIAEIGGPSILVLIPTPTPTPTPMP